MVALARGSMTKPTHSAVSDAQGPTVFVVDDDPGLCRALAYLIESVQLPCQTFSRARDFLTAYDPARPGCVIADVRMPEMSGLEFQEELRARNYEIPVIIVTAFADVPMAVRAVKAGAVEFLEKPFSDQAILECVQQAIQRDKETRERRTAQADFGQRLKQLTRRELEVMDLLVEGRSSKQIASELELSPKTVETHRANVMAKMRVNSLAELIRRKLLFDTDSPRRD
jgi:two-component system, LuxR family, response regulator FixJ